MVYFWPGVNGTIGVNACLLFVAVKSPKIGVVLPFKNTASSLLSNVVINSTLTALVLLYTNCTDVDFFSSAVR